MRPAFSDHLKTTNEPETFPGLAHSKPPRKDAPFLLIVKDFTVDVARRPGGEMIPCAACGTKKKFATGSLAYYPEERVLRVIGNDCGDERRVEANAEYKERTAQKANSEYLLSVLPEVAEHIARMEKLRPAAEHAQALSAQLRQRASAFCKVMIKEIKEGGEVLTRHQLAKDANGRDVSHCVAVHRLTGAGFLRPSYQPATKLRLVSARLYACHLGDEEQSLEWLVAHADDHDELAKLVIVLRSAVKGLDEIYDLLSVARAFLTADNMRGIDKWAYEAGHFEVRAQWGAAQIVFRGPSRNSRTFSTALKPNYVLLEAARPAAGYRLQTSHEARIQPLDRRGGSRRRIPATAQIRLHSPRFDPVGGG